MTPSRKRPTSDRTSWNGKHSRRGRYVVREFANGVGRCRRDHRSVSAQGVGLDQSRARSRLIEKPWLDRFRALLPPAAPILDLGCGSAAPMAAYLIELGHSVVGVDSSPPMIEVCQGRFPDQEWIVADMRGLALQRTFSGILAWDSFFHLCYDDQRRMFPVFRAHAAPNAALMFTSGPAHGEAIGSFGGEPLYHASLDPAEYRSLLDRKGFAWCRMSSRTPTAAATPSGSRSSLEARGQMRTVNAGRWPRFAIMIRSRKRPISDRISWSGSA